MNAKTTQALETALTKIRNLRKFAEQNEIGRLIGECWKLEAKVATWIADEIASGKAGEDVD